MRQSFNFFLKNIYRSVLFFEKNLNHDLHPEGTKFFFPTRVPFFLKIRFFAFKMRSMRFRGLIMHIQYLEYLRNDILKKKFICTHVAQNITSAKSYLWKNDWFTIPSYKQYLNANQNISYIGIFFFRHISNRKKSHIVFAHKRHTFI